MQFANGTISPAYNAQIAVTPREGIIVSIDMTDRRNDAGLAAPMIDDGGATVANEEHVRRLKEGAVGWNAWRANNGPRRMSRFSAHSRAHRLGTSF
jgi:hypothetical protein